MRLAPSDATTMMRLRRLHPLFGIAHSDKPEVAMSHQKHCTTQQPDSTPSRCSGSARSTTQLQHCHTTATDYASRNPTFIKHDPINSLHPGVYTCNWEKDMAYQDRTLPPEAISYAGSDPVAVRCMHGAALHPGM